MTRHIRAAAAALALLLPPGLAGAHVTIDPPEAVAGGYVRVALRVPHGCAGGAATTAIAVEIPDGVYSARPMPKPGWRLVIAHRRLEAPAATPGPHARHLEEGERLVSRITWEGGHLPDEQYEEFVLMLQAPNEPGGALALPVIQRCGARSEDWVERAGPGHDAHDLARPAPVLRLLAPR